MKLVVPSSGSMIQTCSTSFSGVSAGVDLPGRKPDSSAKIAWSG